MNFREQLNIENPPCSGEERECRGQETKRFRSRQTASSQVLARVNRLLVLS